MTALAGIRLTEWTSCGGCAAKWGAGPLNVLVRNLTGTVDDSLLTSFPPSLTTLPTSARSPPPTPALMSSPWEGGSCSP